MSRYPDIVQDEKEAKFRFARQIPADFVTSNSIECLWQEHHKLVREYSRFEKEADSRRDTEYDSMLPKTFLDLKVEIASRIMQNCCFCIRRCGVNRMEGNLGCCKCDSNIHVSSIFEHMGEEPELVPSGTIFTMGCTIKCRHCQNWTISQWLEAGRVYEPEQLAKKVEELHNNGCKNVNLVGGEPTPNLYQWLRTFRYVNVNIPIVWNSNSYYSPETAELLAGFVDIYLLDFKYGSEACAKKISDAPHYWETCVYNHLQAKKYGELIVRVLVLPGHLECCTKPILDWVAENLGVETRVNLMFQYRPEWRAYEIPELSTRLRQDEINRAVQLADQAGLSNFIA